MMAEDGGATIALRGVSRVYGAARAVDGLDLDVAGGEILALLGPSGCGKTTTLRMVAGLVQPSAGEIAIDGQSITGLPVHRRNLGMLFQNYALFPHLSVQENVTFGLAMRGIGRAEAARRASEALALARLEGFEARMPAELSGGQQQRVALARAIVYRPRVLLLDEPFAALDRKLREQMQVELRLLCNTLRLTTIIVTHDQEEALILADRIAIMRAGRIEQVAAARAVYEHPDSHFVADFMGSANFLPARIVAREDGIIRLAGPAGQAYRSTAASPPEPGARVAIAIRPEHVRLFPGDTLDEVNAISGTVRRSLFRGQSLSVWLDVDGMAFLASLPVDGARDPRPGEVWTARWSAERTLVVREQ